MGYKAHRNRAGTLKIKELKVPREIKKHWKHFLSHPIKEDGSDYYGVIASSNATVSSGDSHVHVATLIQTMRDNQVINSESSVAKWLYIQEGNYIMCCVHSGGWLVRGLIPGKDNKWQYSRRRWREMKRKKKKRDNLLCKYSCTWRRVDSSVFDDNNCTVCWDESCFFLMREPRSQNWLKGWIKWSDCTGGQWWGGTDQRSPP